MAAWFASKRLLPGLVGLELGAAGVAVAQVVRDSGRPPAVTACEFRSWNGDDRERVLARLAGDYHMKRVRCTTVLDASDYSLLLTEAPDVPREELRSAIRWRIKDLVDFHLDDATIDVFDVDSPRARAKQRAMYAVVAKNSAIRWRVDLCDAAGVQLDVIDIPEMAQRNIAAVLPEDARGLAMLAFTPSHGLLTITRQGELYLSRRLDLGTEQLQGPQGIDFFQQVVLEVQRSLDYYDSHFQQPPVVQLTLAPSAAAVPRLTEFLGENLGIKVAAMNLGAHLTCAPAAAEALGGRAWSALGAALRQEAKAL